MSEARELASAEAPQAVSRLEEFGAVMTGNADDMRYMADFLDKLNGSEQGRWLGRILVEQGQRR